MKLTNRILPSTMAVSKNCPYQTSVKRKIKEKIKERIGGEANNGNGFRVKLSKRILPPIPKIAKREL